MVGVLRHKAKRQPLWLVQAIDFIGYDNGAHETLEALPIEDFRQDSEEFQRFVRVEMPEEDAKARVVDGNPMSSIN